MHPFNILIQNGVRNGATLSVAIAMMIHKLPALSTPICVPKSRWLLLLSSAFRLLLLSLLMSHWHGTQTQRKISWVTGSITERPVVTTIIPWRSEIRPNTPSQDLEEGLLYYFAATAYDLSWNESGYSNEVAYAPPCSYSIAPTSQSFDYSGGTGVVNVTAEPDCSWTAVSNASWLLITSNSSGSGNGTIHYTVSTNSETLWQNRHA